jgi:putative membrane protein
MTQAKLKYLAVPLLAALFGAVSVQAQTQQPATTATTTSTATTAQPMTKLAKSDHRMLEQLARANMAEIEAGKIALQKSQNEEVKAFAKKMVDDHTKGLQEVHMVAQTKGVTLPSEVDAKHKAMAKKLNGLSGDAFDRAYLAQAGVSDHKKAHAMLQKVQMDAKDPDVKALAGKLEPTVAEHMTKVDTLNATMKGSTAAGASGMGTSGSGKASDKMHKDMKTDKDMKTMPAKPDKTSGNTDNPENPQNPTPNPNKGK